MDAQDTRTPVYGVRRMTAWVRAPGDAGHHQRVARLRPTRGREPRDTKPQPSQAPPGHRGYPDGLRGVPMTRGTQVGSPEITSIRLQGGVGS